MPRDAFDCSHERALIQGRFVLECNLYYSGSVVQWLGRWTCDFCVAASSPGHDTAWLFLRQVNYLGM